jgi:uncharacterized membrane-anchored protein YhcB (DUF1043 family)
MTAMIFGWIIGAIIAFILVYFANKSVLTASQKRKVIADFEKRQEELEENILFARKRK